MIIFDYNNDESLLNEIPLKFIPYNNKNKKKYKDKNIIINRRTFVTTEDIKCILSDGRTIIIPKGTGTDLMSIPKFLWSFFSPIDSAFIGDLLHDYLYVDKINEIKYFNNNIFKAQKFADKERNLWRQKITKLTNEPLKLKNYITNTFLILFAKNFYIKKYNIPT